MVEYGLLDKEKAENYKDFLSPEAYSRRKEESVFYYGAICDEKVVGVAAFIADDESELLSVSVSPKWQKQGIGSELVDGIVDIVKDCGSALLETFLFVQEGNESGMDKFLWRCGFYKEEEYLVGGFCLKDMKRIDAVKKVIEKGIPKHVTSLSEVSDAEINRFGRELMRKELYTGWETTEFQKQVSSVYLEGGQIEACLLFSDYGDELHLEYAYVDPKSDNPMIFLYLTANAVLKAESEYADDTKISALAINEISEKLLEKLCGDTLQADTLFRYAMHFPNKNHK